MRKKAAGVIAIENGKILMVKATNKSQQLVGTVAFPGGKVDPNETESQAAIREFNEETGMNVAEIIEFPGNYFEGQLELKEGVIDYSFRAYIGKDFSGSLTGSEETEAFWMELDEARKTKLLGAGNLLLENAIKFLNIQ